jgi:hypothetical protein
MCAEIVQFINHHSFHDAKKKKKNHHPHIVYFDRSFQLSIGQRLLLGHLLHSKVPIVVEPFSRILRGLPFQ